MTDAPIPGPYYRHGAARLKQGISRPTVERELVAQGLSPERAAQVVRELVTAFRDQAPTPRIANGAARAEMITGGVICAIGIAITAATYSSATHSPHGGTYVLAWGPIIFGGLRFFRGLSKL